MEDEYRINDEEMDMMLKSMNYCSTEQEEYVEEGGAEEFDWGRMNDALGEAQPVEQAQNVEQEDTAASSKVYDMATIRDEIEREAEVRREQERERIKRQKEQEAMEKAKRKRIKYKPPGLNIFNSTQEPFRFFSYKNLCLVNDFGYAPKYKERGYSSDSELRDVLSNPVKFIMHLSPETTSNLIHNKEDFEKICSYFFFSLASFYEDGEDSHDISMYDHFDMFKKALFDLLRNYGFTSFRLGLKHIFTCLLNLGFDEAVLLNEEHYKKALEDRINTVTEWYKTQKKHYNWALPKFDEFFVTRRQQPPGPPSTEELEKSYRRLYTDDECSDELNRGHKKILTEDVGGEKEKGKDAELPIPSRADLLQIQQMECIKSFVELVSDLIITFHDDRYVR